MNSPGDEKGENTAERAPMQRKTSPARILRHWQARSARWSTRRATPPDAIATPVLARAASWWEVGTSAPVASNRRGAESGWDFSRTEPARIPFAASLRAISDPPGTSADRSGEEISPAPRTAAQTFRRLGAND